MRYTDFKLLPRRELLLGGLTLPFVHWGTTRAQYREVTPAKAKKCILVWLDGGPSHFETFDPKPTAPAEVRGPLRSIATSVPGIEVAESLPSFAKRMQHWSLIRSMTSPLGEHNLGTHYLLTGFAPSPAIAYPSMGAIINQLRAPGVLPNYIAVPDHRVGGAAFSANGYLPSSNAPFELKDDPARQGFQIRDLGGTSDESVAAIARRRRYFEFQNQVERSSAKSSSSGDSNLAAQKNGWAQAFELTANKQARTAFDLDQESDSLRDRYGRRTVGQSCLLARRLIERDVSFVTVNVPGWDTHDNILTKLHEGFKGAKDPVGLVPLLDHALGALIDDLKERGLLDETLVVVMGEFGRTPKLNAQGGRDHWPRVFSVAVAGGGTPGGQVIGASDRLGEVPAENPITPAAFAKTVLELLGVDTSQKLATSDGREIPIANEAATIEALFR